MEDLKLEKNEGILLMTTEAWRYFDGKELAVDTLYLTNKNLISVYEKSKGIFSKRETVIDKMSLTSISIIDDVVQVKKVKDDDYGESLQIIFNDGRKELIEFTEAPKKEYQQWKVAISDAVIECSGKKNIDNSDNIIAQNPSAVEIHETVKFNKNEMRFCSFCGTNLDEGARFCKHCGKSINRVNESVPEVKMENSLEYESFSRKPITERRTVYEGNLHKCPSCGEILKSFAANCPSCGHEIRDIEAAGSISGLAMKLEKIEAQKMPAFEEKRSFMKMMIGKDLGDEDEADEARKRFKKQKKQEKANIIMNYPVPNTKEDIMEFMLLASSNINLKSETDDVVNNAWISKLEQAYEKAKLSMGGSHDFIQIQNIYEQKKKQLKDRKFRRLMLWVGGVALYFFLMGLLWNPSATIAISLGLIVLMIIVFILFKKR